MATRAKTSASTDITAVQVKEEYEVLCKNSRIATAPTLDKAKEAIEKHVKKYNLYLEGAGAWFSVRLITPVYELKVETKTTLVLKK